MVSFTLPNNSCAWLNQSNLIIWCYFGTSTTFAVSTAFIYPFFIPSWREGPVYPVVTWAAFKATDTLYDTLRRCFYSNNKCINSAFLINDCLAVGSCGVMAGWLLRIGYRINISCLYRNRCHKVVTSGTTVATWNHQYTKITCHFTDSKEQFLHVAISTCSPKSKVNCS